MESNGKGVTMDGTRLPGGVEAGPIVFGEPVLTVSIVSTS